MSSPTLDLSRTGSRVQLSPEVQIPSEMLVFSQRGKRPRSFALCRDAIRRLQEVNPDLVLSERLRVEISDQEDALVVARSASSDTRLRGFPEGSMPHQRSGARWLRERRRALLADSQGTGKTVTALIAIERSDAAVLIVCSNTKRKDWCDHVEEWTHLRPRVVESSRLDDEIAPGEAVVMGYEAARRHEKRLSGDYLIVDEAHNLRNRATAQTKGIARLSRRFRHLYLLTATPVVNRADDVWTLLHMIDRERFSSYWSLVCRFQSVVQEYFGVKVGGFRSDEEKDRFWSLLGEYMLLRPKDASVLPRLVRRVEDYELPPEQRALYDAILTNDEATFGEARVETVEMVAKITRLRQLALHPALIWPDYRGPSKVDRLREMIARDDAPFVVFSMFADLVRLALADLRSDGHAVDMITGDVSGPNREQALEDFARGRTRGLVVTHGTGGEGLNLVQARRAIMLDLHWHPAGNAQARDRIYRYGQTAEEVEVVYLRSLGTIEQHVMEILQRKEPVIVERIAERLRT